MQCHERIPESQKVDKRELFDYYLCKNGSQILMTWYKEGVNVACALSPVEHQFSWSSWCGGEIS